MLGWSRWVSLLCTFGWWKKCIVVFRFWIIFTLIILIYFSCRLPISSSFIWFGGHLSCSFTCWVFLCLFILFILLCLRWPFCILAVCGSSLLWRFLPVGGVGWVACQGFLVREACVSVLVGGAGSLLSEVQLTSNSEFWGVYGFGMVWWAFIMFLYLMNISLPFDLVWIAVFGVAILYAGSLWFPFIVEFPPCG